MTTERQGNIMSVLALWALLFVLLNGEANFARFGIAERWFGWPFAYYGNESAGSLEVTIYAVPMLLDALVCALISVLCVVIIMGASRRFRIDLGAARKPFRVLSLAVFTLFIMALVALAHGVSRHHGPRGQLEASGKIIIGPRFVTNPLG